MRVAGTVVLILSLMTVSVPATPAEDTGIFRPDANISTGNITRVP